MIDAIRCRDVGAAQDRYIRYLSRAQATAIQIIEANSASGAEKLHAAIPSPFSIS
jgi:hypothetical protein